MNREEKEGEIKGKREIGRVNIMDRMRVKGIILMMMIVMGCNSGGVKDPEKVFLSEMVNLGRGFLDVFVSFGDMITGTLGIKADTKKSEIGGYFSKIENTMKVVKVKLGKILEEHGSYEKVKGKVEEFIGKIGKIEEGAKKAALGANDDAVIGEVVKSAVAGVNSPNAGSVKNLVEGIKEIVDLVITEGNGQADKTNPLDADKKDIGKLFGAKNEDDKGAEEKHIAAASASIGAVSGADILKAIAGANADAKKDGKVKEAKDAAALALAKGTTVDNDDQLEDLVKKDAIIAAGIALRGMAKEGKFIVKNDAASKTEAEGAKGAAANAVNKVLSTLVMAIRNTVDLGLKEINKVLGEIKQGEASEAKVSE
ncbi:variable large family protein [Borrelia crocidurae]|uniref:Variable large protein n=1 Tax=Borrelia crocidurae (strain Achema) TaxID=1155096 RepID=I0FEQ7_BORCA|nr:variable large family protein [Borrelia crocidurae]AFI31963.1 Vlp protein, delta subfamily [Borrelia crocidurae str. Achema]